MNMSLEAFVLQAVKRGASDVHLEPGHPPGFRVRGELLTAGEPVLPATLVELARGLLGDRRWTRFLERKSDDLSRTLSGVRCRINVLRSSRGVGFAIRLLSTFQPTLQRLNLHPDLDKLVRHRHGLVLFSGPTGSGKSSTLAALIQAINVSEARHILTIEHPIEYAFRSRREFIRQREVGRDTPSFDQGLIDAMREDPDIIMVGEMREPETMRLTLNAAETGHLVLATVHSSNCAEALQRVAGSFPAEIQPGICNQLADCLRGAVSQTLIYREDLGIRVPVLEMLVATTPIKSLIRQGMFFKLAAALETGAQDGQWTAARYRSWLDRRDGWFISDDHGVEPLDSEILPLDEFATPTLEPGVTPLAAPPEQAAKDVIEIEPPAETIDDIISELEDS